MLALGVLNGGKIPTAELRQAVKQCEAWGYQYYWHSDERFFRDPYAGLAVCAVDTERIQLGVAVTDPYSRHPALTAMGIATVDEVSNGRAILGIGAGVAGFKELGIKPERPVRAIREMVELTRELATNRRVTYHGQLVQFEDGILSVPMRRDLPIFIAGMGSQMVQLAGEIGDGLIISSCVADAGIDQTRELLAKGARKAGRDPSAAQLASRVNVAIADDGDAARWAVKQRLAPMIVSKRPDFSFLDQVGLSMPSTMADLVASARYAYDDEAKRQMRRIAEAMPDEFADRLGLAGTRDEVAASVRRMAARGVGQLIAYPMPVEGQSRDDVLAELARLTLGNQMVGD